MRSKSFLPQMEIHLKGYWNTLFENNVINSSFFVCRRLLQSAEAWKSYSINRLSCLHEKAYLYERCKCEMLISHWRNNKNAFRPFFHRRPFAPVPFTYLWPSRAKLSRTQSYPRVSYSNLFTFTLQPGWFYVPILNHFFALSCGLFFICTWL